jgi:hypothetical protein
MDFDSLGIKLETFLLVGQELLNILTLISLQLNHLSHLSVIDDGAIACYESVSRLIHRSSVGGSGNNIPNFFLITFKIFF